MNQEFEDPNHLEILRSIKEMLISQKHLSSYFEALENYNKFEMLPTWSYTRLGKINPEGEFIVEPAFLDSLRDLVQKVIRDIRHNDCTPVLYSEHWKKEAEKLKIQKNDTQGTNY